MEFNSHNLQNADFLGFGSSYQQDETHGSLTIEDALNDTERSYYYGLFQMISKDGEYVQGDILIDFLKKSGLTNDILKNLWQKCASSNANNLKKLEFFKMMRGIAMVQNMVDYNNMLHFFLDRTFPYLPVFEGIPTPQNPNVQNRASHKPEMLYPAITPVDLIKYEALINEVSIYSK